MPDSRDYPRLSRRDSPDSPDHPGVSSTAMSDRGRYDSAMFWLAFGTATAVIGLALMTIGVTRSSPRENLLSSPWFDGGLGVLVLGALLLLWALGLFLSRRRDATPTSDPKSAADADWMGQAVRGYYKERDSLFRMWQKDRKNWR